MQEARLSTLEWVTRSLEEWRPSIDGTVDDIRLEVGKLTKQWERVVRACSPPLLNTSLPAAERPSAPGYADRPNGHHSDNHLREDGYGSVTTLTSPGQGYVLSSQPSFY